jgi:hypothetical protein
MIEPDTSNVKGRKELTGVPGRCDEVFPSESLDSTLVL